MTNNPNQKIIKYFPFMILVLLSCGSVSPTQNSDIGKLLEGKQYVFLPQTAFPARGSSVTVSGGNYDLKIIKDSVSVYLPFYGRANDISAARTGGPVELNTKKFSYKIE